MSLAFLVPPLVAAFLIGACFRARRWAAVPPVVMFVAGTSLLLIPYQVVAPSVPRSMVQDLTYVEATVFAGFIMVFGVAILLLLLALVAATGVRWGRRREAATLGSATNSLSGEPSTEADALGERSTGA